MSGADVLYISADVEFDGPLVGRNSMVQFGLYPAGLHHSDGSFDPDHAQGRGYKSTLRPISLDYDPETFAVSGLNRRDLMASGVEPVEAMTGASRYIEQIADGAKPVLILHPVAVDWAWLHYYWTRFDPDGCPFGYNAAVDLRSIYMGLSGVSYPDSAPSKMPERLRSDKPHTHDALDDARYQADIFTRVMLESRRLAVVGP